MNKDISPLLISSGNEEFEAIIVQVKIGSRNLRIFNCYGPQELSQAQRSVSEQEVVIGTFWQELEKKSLRPMMMVA